MSASDSYEAILGEVNPVIAEAAERVRQILMPQIRQLFDNDLMPELAVGTIPEKLIDDNPRATLLTKMRGILIVDNVRLRQRSVVMSSGGLFSCETTSARLWFDKPHSKPVPNMSTAETNDTLWLNHGVDAETAIRHLLKNRPE